MAESTGSSRGLARLWRRRGAQAPPGPPGSARAVGSALFALERRISQALVRPPERSGQPIPANAFGPFVREDVVAGAVGRLARATGMALAGLRASAFLGSEELLEIAAALQGCAARHVPLVVHVDLGQGGHDGIHALAETECIQVVASSGQQALDWTVLARWLSERALVPVVVAVSHDGVESVDLLEDAKLADFLGRPDDRIESPSEAQRLLLGPERPRVLPWFDLDRPVATGGPREGGDEAQRRRAEHAYFWGRVPKLAQQGAEMLEGLTGRPLAGVEVHGLDDAELILVGQGATVQAARAVAAHRSGKRGPRVGVLGISLLRPFPAGDVAALLEGRRAVGVVERRASPSGAPLWQEVAAAVGASDGWISALCGRRGPEPRALVALCELLRAGQRPRRVHLDRIAEPATTGHPRRDVLLQSAARAHPELARWPLPDAEAPAADPPAGRSVGLLARDENLSEDAVSHLADALRDAVGGFVCGWDLRAAPGVRDLRLRAAPAPFPDPGARTPVGLLWVDEGGWPEPAPELAVAAGGSVLVASDADPDRVWAGLAASWRRRVREGALRLFAVGGGVEGGIEALRSLLRGEEGERLREVSWRDLPQPEAADRPLPQLVRRLSRSRDAHDSLPRFWGEVVQPRQDGAADGWPDPLSAVAAVPALASALESEPAAASLPVLDAGACTGCGRCWSACPDSAIGTTALGAEPLLTAASRVAATEGPAADAVRRAHKHWAGRIAGDLAKSGAGQLDAAALTQAWEWVEGRLNLSPQDQPAYTEAARATAAALARLEPVVARPLWGEAEEEKKGSGALLVLAVDPRACVGCGLCVAVCPESALRLEAREPERVEAFRERWRAWEELPDTPGDVLARAAGLPEPGPLAAALLSRHCAQAQVGGAGGEPGSGERLAARLVAAFAEVHGQRSNTKLIERFEQQRSRLEQEVRKQLGAALSEPELDVLGEAAAGIRRERADLGSLVERLDQLGSPARFDRAAVLRMTRAATQLDEERERLARGQDGLGRARFGVVVAGDRTAEWVARYPHHPYFAPLTVAPTAEGAELAHGIATAVAARHVALVRALRRAELEAEAPRDRSERLEALGRLAWSDLERDERAGCPPVVLLGDEAALRGRGFELVARLLDTDLPVKVVLLDGRGRLGEAPEPALLAMARRRAFVLAASLAHPNHLARGLGDALAWPGPAFVHLHTPSPRRDGFPVEATLERARLAVESRAHILLRYDPEAEGVFGLRASLAGNPEPEADWGELHFAAWAAGEARFAGCFEPSEEGAGVPLEEWLALEPGARRNPPTLEHDGRRLVVAPALARAAAERKAVWDTLRELTGLAGPFASRIRAELEEELGAAHRAELEALEREHAARVAEARAGADAEALRRLTDRLLALSGFPSAEASGEGRP